MPCPSSASHRNRGKHIMKPGPMTYPEEKLLQFLGQLLAITIRADIPFGLDLLPVFWKNLVGLDLDPITDLQEADILTYGYIKKFEMVSFSRKPENLISSINYIEEIQLGKLNITIIHAGHRGWGEEGSHW